MCVYVTVQGAADIESAGPVWVGSVRGGDRGVQPGVWLGQTGARHVPRRGPAVQARYRQPATWDAGQSISLSETQSRLVIDNLRLEMQVSLSLYQKHSPGLLSTTCDLRCRSVYVSIRNTVQARYRQPATWDAGQSMSIRNTVQARYRQPAAWDAGQVSLSLYQKHSPGSLLTTCDLRCRSVYVSIRNTVQARHRQPAAWDAGQSISLSETQSRLVIDNLRLEMQVSLCLYQKHSPGSSSTTCDLRCRSVYVSIRNTVQACYWQPAAWDAGQSMSLSETQSRLVIDNLRLEMQVSLCLYQKHSPGLLLTTCDLRCRSGQSIDYQKHSPGLLSTTCGLRCRSVYVSIRNTVQACYWQPATWDAGQSMSLSETQSRLVIDNLRLEMQVSLCLYQKHSPGLLLTTCGLRCRSVYVSIRNTVQACYRQPATWDAGQSMSIRNTVQACYWQPAAWDTGQSITIRNTVQACYRQPATWDAGQSISIRNTVQACYWQPATWDAGQSMSLSETQSRLVIDNLRLEMQVSLCLYQKHSPGLLLTTCDLRCRSVYVSIRNTVQACYWQPATWDAGQSMSLSETQSRLVIDNLRLEMQVSLCLYQKHSPGLLLTTCDLRCRSVYLYQKHSPGSSSTTCGLRCRSVYVSIRNTVQACYRQPAAWDAGQSMSLSETQSRLVIDNLRLEMQVSLCLYQKHSPGLLLTTCDLRCRSVYHYQKHSPGLLLTTCGLRCRSVYVSIRNTVQACYRQPATWDAGQSMSLSETQSRLVIDNLRLEMQVSLCLYQKHSPGLLSTTCDLRCRSVYLSIRNTVQACYRQPATWDAGQSISIRNTVQACYRQPAAWDAGQSMSLSETQSRLVIDNLRLEMQVSLSLSETQSRLVIDNLRLEMQVSLCLSQKHSPGLLSTTCDLRCRSVYVYQKHSPGLLSTTCGLRCRSVYVSLRNTVQACYRQPATWDAGQSMSLSETQSRLVIDNLRLEMQVSLCLYQKHSPGLLSTTCGLRCRSVYVSLRNTVQACYRQPATWDAGQSMSLSETQSRLVIDNLRLEMQVSLSLYQKHSPGLLSTTCDLRCRSVYVSIRNTVQACYWQPATWDAGQSMSLSETQSRLVIDNLRLEMQVSLCLYQKHSPGLLLTTCDLRCRSVYVSIRNTVQACYWQPATWDAGQSMSLSETQSRLVIDNLRLEMQVSLSLSETQSRLVIDNLRLEMQVSLCLSQKHSPGLLSTTCDLRCRSVYVSIRNTVQACYRQPATWDAGQSMSLSETQSRLVIDNLRLEMQVSLSLSETQSRLVIDNLRLEMQVSLCLYQKHSPGLLSTTCDLRCRSVYVSLRNTVQACYRQPATWDAGQSMSLSETQSRLVIDNLRLEMQVSLCLYQKHSPGSSSTTCGLRCRSVYVSQKHRLVTEHARLLGHIYQFSYVLVFIFRASCYSTCLSRSHTPVMNWAVCLGQYG